MATNRISTPIPLSSASRMNNPRAVHTTAALQKQQVGSHSAPSTTQSAKIIKDWRNDIPNGAHPDVFHDDCEEEGRANLTTCKHTPKAKSPKNGSIEDQGSANYSLPSFQFPRSQPKAQPVYTTPVQQPKPQDQLVYTTPGPGMLPALQPGYKPPSLLSLSRAQDGIDKFPPLQPAPRPQPGYVTPVLQPPIRAQTPPIAVYTSQGAQAASQAQTQSQSGSLLNAQAFQAAVELQKKTQARSVSAYNAHGLAAATRFVGSGRPKTGGEIEALKKKVQEEKEKEAQKQEAQKQEAQKQEAQKQEAQKQEAQKQEAQKQEAQKQEAQKQEAQKQEAVVTEGTCHADLKGIELFPDPVLDPDPPHPSSKNVSPMPSPSPKTVPLPTLAATPKPSTATMSTPSPTRIEPSYPHPRHSADGTQTPLPLKRTPSNASLAETCASLTSTTNVQTTARLLILLPRSRLRIIKLSRCPDTSDLETFLFQTLRIPPSEKSKYEILWVRETERWGVEEVCMDGEDAWEFLKEEVLGEGDADGDGEKVGGKRGREVRIRVVEVEGDVAG